MDLSVSSQGAREGRARRVAPAPELTLIKPGKTSTRNLASVLRLLTGGEGKKTFNSRDTQIALIGVQVTDRIVFARAQTGPANYGGHDVGKRESKYTPPVELQE
jgi:hypothetical protein